ncbi:MAG: glycosyltransferase [Polyangiaceae bacterium]|jgi:glycosyltransferase involved in cell wall biosynthesis
MERLQTPAIALVLATYNRAKPLERLLAALERQTIPRDQWEVIVAVDGSTDGTELLLEDWLRRGSLPLRYFSQENAGQSVARHNGILKTPAEHVIIIDDDMEVCPEFVAEHLAASQRVPGATVVIGKVVPVPSYMNKPLYSAVVEHHLHILHERIERGEQPVTATAFVTQNVSFPRRLYLDVGGFDPSLRLDEDRELGIRFERGGASFAFSSKAWAIHHSDIGSYDKWFHRQYEYGKYAIQIWEKHGRNPHLHPLRNFVNGSRLNRALVTLVCPDDARSRLATSTLRRLGQALQRFELFFPAVATHKAIQAVRYHQGVRDRLGSWSAVRDMERDFLADPARPLGPTGQGLTYEGSSRTN